ncbi:heparinase II/III-family protein [Paenibacillus soyae]|uniref:Heparinase II/III-family protein n=1 Tax=Paenibacillus soyae TaxID=2969249 RepID=A0A9X2S7K3_9BACL|nr:heparinase II/III-family protein [Paenibacillus soyae]MCR2803419.1 heparinase II/III-family protein [Paenibacillus soyae]
MLEGTLTAMPDRVRGFGLLLGELGADDWAARLLGDASLSGLIGEIEAEAERLLDEPEPELTDDLFRLFAETGDRLAYENVYFAKRKRLNAFAIMAWLKPEKTSYREALRLTALSICDEYTWCLPAHYGEKRGPYGNIDLFAAETGFTLSEMSALLGDKLDAELRERIAFETERRLFAPFLEQGPYPWEKLENNWSSVCAGSVGAAALYAIEDTERLARVLERTQAAMDCFLAGYGDDGACVEGYSYWQYGFGYYVYYADLLKRATGGAIDGFAIPKVKEIALFQQRCFSCGDTVINFSDSPQRCGIFMGLTMRLRDEYPEVAVPHASLREPYAADHCGRWAPAIRNLIWASAERAAVAKGAGETGAAEASDKIEEADAAGEWPTEAHYMADAGWFMSRYAAEDGSVYGFAAKGGHNGESHNHNDCGHFLLHADGEVYLADIGRGLYTKEYFGPDRYSFWCNGSQGHSLPIVGGALQAEGAERKAIVTEASVSDREDRFALELSGAYPEAAGLLGLERSFAWRKEGTPALTLVDSFAFAVNEAEPVGGSGEQIIERFITFMEPKLVKEGILSLTGSRRVHIEYDAAAWRPVVTSRSDLDHFAEERYWYTLDFHQLDGGVEGGRATARFAFVFQEEAAKR